VFDHIVEQSHIGRSGFLSQQIHNPANLNPVPRWVNQVKANYYSSVRLFTEGRTVRDWLSRQSFEAQYRFGIKATEDIIAGLIR
jgi:hypothetical protein